MARTTPPESRFWAKVAKGDPHECWLWLGAKDPKKGHGSFWVSYQRANVKAHAYAKELATGVARPAGMFACHRCDNPPCVNPEHIYYGTRQDNIDDSIRRGRNTRGSASPFARLTEEQVVVIRERYASGTWGHVLAAEFGVNEKTINRIARGEKWRYAPGPITRRGRGRRPGLVPPLTDTPAAPGGTT